MDCIYLNSETFICYAPGEDPLDKRKCADVPLKECQYKTLNKDEILLIIKNCDTKLVEKIQILINDYNARKEELKDAEKGN